MHVSSKMCSKKRSNARWQTATAVSGDYFCRRARARRVSGPEKRQRACRPQRQRFTTRTDRKKNASSRRGSNSRRRSRRGGARRGSRLGLAQRNGLGRVARAWPVTARACDGEKRGWPSPVRALASRARPAAQSHAPEDLLEARRLLALLDVLRVLEVASPLDLRSGSEKRARQRASARTRCGAPATQVGALATGCERRADADRGAGCERLATPLPATRAAGAAAAHFGTATRAGRPRLARATHARRAYSVHAAGRGHERARARLARTQAARALRSTRALKARASAHVARPAGGAPRAARPSSARPCESGGWRTPRAHCRPQAPGGAVRRQCSRDSNQQPARVAPPC